MFRSCTAGTTNLVLTPAVNVGASQPCSENLPKRSQKNLTPTGRNTPLDRPTQQCQSTKGSGQLFIGISAANSTAGERPSSCESTSTKTARSPEGAPMSRSTATPELGPTSPRWPHIALRVSDIDATIDWYHRREPRSPSQPCTRHDGLSSSLGLHLGPVLRTRCAPIVG